MNTVFKKYSNDDIQQAIYKIQLGDFDRNLVKMLLMEIRDYLGKTNPIREIANFIAHPKRDQGSSFEHINKFIKEFLAANENGGSFRVRALFSKRELINVLVKNLKDFGFIIDPMKFSDHMEDLILCISEIIEDTEFHLKNDFIDYAKIVKTNGTISFVFQVNNKHIGKIKFRPNVSIGIPFFG
jgi:hypothetical protein